MLDKPFFLGRKKGKVFSMNKNICSLVPQGSLPTLLCFFIKESSIHEAAFYFSL